MKRLPLLLLTVMFFLPLPACALSGKAIEGTVLEEGTNKPVPEAIVIARWSGHLATFAHGKTVCYHVLSTTTDENGTYRFPAWKKKITEDWQKNVDPETVVITAHKPGYEEYRPPGYVRTEEFKRNIRYLQPFTGGRGERLEYLKRVSGATGCSDKKEIERNLLPLYRALYEEAKGIAVTKEDREKVETLLFGLESIEFGSIEALNRMTERRKMQK